MRPDLIVVVDPDYGVGLEKIAQSAPIWVTESEINKKACQQYWVDHPQRDHREIGAVTLYKAVNPMNRLAALHGVLPQLEDHHGEVEGNFLLFPSGFVLEVIGLPLGNEVQAALRERGFTYFADTTEGFQARK